MRTTLIVALSALLLCGCAAQTVSDSFTATYRCDNGTRVQARYFPPDNATVTVGGYTVDMHVARSASGTRYVGGTLTWWTQGGGPGSHGTLFTHNPETGVTGERITRCVQVARRGLGAG